MFDEILEDLNKIQYFLEACINKIKEIQSVVAAERKSMPDNSKEVRPDYSFKEYKSENWHNPRQF